VKKQALGVRSNLQFCCNDARIFQFYVMFCIYLRELMCHTRE